MTEWCHHPSLPEGGKCAECGYVRDVVNCDRECGAKLNPTTLEEFAAALEHWRRHPWLSGCSHGE